VALVDTKRPVRSGHRRFSLGRLARSRSRARPLFLAGKAFQSHRARGGSKAGMLPDFFIGAHAVVEGIGLLTRDTRRYRSYFPTVELITPGDA
jgi:predicted nucleic acid-binding protein